MNRVSILDACDPGIRETVRLLLDCGFKTTDSGDGVSKPRDWEGVLPFPHVAAEVSREELISESHRMLEVLGEKWSVEATYFPASETAILLASLPEGS